jgi:hypothetical protein
MKTKQYTTIDRASLGWPAGPWDGEPDKVQWPDAETGLPCLAVRNPRSGNWCGYVGVAEGHPLYRKGYDDEAVYSANVGEVHGGLTFSGACRPSEDESRGICHTPSAGEPDHVWWFGFDCAHCDDHSPDDVKRAEAGGIWRLDPRSAYRTLAYVQDECRALAKQLAAVS